MEEALFPPPSSSRTVIGGTRGHMLPVDQAGMWPTPPDTSSATESTHTSMAVRDAAGFEGVRHAIEHEASIPINVPTDPKSHVHFRPGGMQRDEDLERLADAYQHTSTSRAWAPSAAYPGQQRPGEPHRESRVKNLKDFELMGRDIGTPHDAVGGYVGMTQAGSDVDEKATQRTYNDLHYTYFNPAPPTKTERGNNSAYNQNFQNRMGFREETYKNAPGRAGGVFASEWIRPGFSNEELWRSGTQGHAPRDTMKADDPMVFRQRADENPNREGLRMQYSDVYASGFEALINTRRVQTDVTEDIDHNLILAYNVNPFTQPIGIVPPRD